jgi:hypothetical protein
MKLVRRSLLFAALSIPVAFAAAQDTPLGPQVGKSEVERLKAWPTLEGKELDAMRLDIERLRKARTDEMGDEAHKALVAVGSAVVPELLPVLGKEKDIQALIRVEDVLTEITNASHTRLLAPEFANKSRDIRTWALRRCGQFPDPELKAPAEAALAKALATTPKSDDKEDAAAVNEERYAAALCAAAAGSVKALPVLEKWVLESWGKRGVEMRAAFEAMRGKEGTEYARPMVLDKDRKRVVAGLNMVAGLGTLDAAAFVRPQLDSTDNSIRVAAINAMRGIFDNQPPIANLPVFEAIELAKKWKERR